MPDPVGRFYTGTYVVDGDTEGLSPQNVDSEEGVQAVTNFVAAGLEANASPITITRQE